MPVLPMHFSAVNFLGRSNNKISGVRLTKVATSPCVLGGPCLGGRATSPVPSLGPLCSPQGKNQTWPKSRQDGYITPTFLGVPNAQHRGKIRKGSNLSKMATEHVPSWGS